MVLVQKWLFLLKYSKQNCLFVSSHKYQNIVKYAKKGHFIGYGRILKEYENNP